MKRLVSVTMLAASLLALPPAVRAQECSHLNTYDLRGTYTIDGSGWINLATALPMIPGLPNQFVPMSWVAAEVFDGFGNGSGWLSLNAGGTQMSATFVNKKYSVQADCSVQITYSIKINELNGLVIGPFSRLAVPEFQQTLIGSTVSRLHMITVGAAPNTAPAPLVDSAIATRISLAQ